MLQSTLESSTGLEAGSVTIQLEALKRGDSNAQEWIFARLLPEVLQLARTRVGSCQSRYHDEFEIAVEVLGVLMMRASTFGQLKNRSDLSRLLHKLVKHKSIDAYRKMRRRQKLEVGESWLGRNLPTADGGQGSRSFGFSSEATQSIAIDLFDSLCQTIRSLNDDELQCRQILRLLLEGYSVAEISQMVGRGERSVYRLLLRIESRFLTPTHNSTK
jgi:RNA polymerase sigma factor (sigma-70 family)